MNEKLKMQYRISLLVIAVPAIGACIAALMQPDHAYMYWSMAAICLLSLGMQVLMHTLTIRQTVPIGSEKAEILTIWLIPAITWFAAAEIAFAIEGKLQPLPLTLLFVGLILAACGNYLPKASPNTVFGARMKYALENRQNWQITQRAAGYSFVGCGLAIMLLALAGTPENENWIMFAVLALVLLSALIPAWVSWNNYRKQKKAGTWQKNLDLAPAGSLFGWSGRKTGAVSILLTVLIAGGITLMCMSAGFSVRFEQDALAIDARMVSSQTIPYDSVESVTWIEDPDYGSRTFGYGGLKKIMGRFSSPEFGDYTLYGWKSQPAVEIVHDGTVTVISMEDSAQTKEFYERLKNRTAGFE